MPVISPRHSNVPREPQSPRQHHHGLHEREHHHHAGAQLSDEEAERLAHKITETGCQYISDKTSARYSELEVAQGDAAVAADVDPGAVANKVMKEGAREMERQEGKHHGRVFSGSDAALAQSVAHWKDDASAPEHKVAEKIRQRIAHTQDVYAHPIAQGPNPDAGRDRNDTRMRHFRGSPNWDHVTATTRHERNPDVIRE